MKLNVIDAGMLSMVGSAPNVGGMALLAAQPLWSRESCGPQAAANGLVYMSMIEYQVRGKWVFGDGLSQCFGTLNIQNEAPEYCEYSAQRCRTKALKTPSSAEVRRKILHRSATVVICGDPNDLVVLLQSQCDSPRGFATLEFTTIISIRHTQTPRQPTISTNPCRCVITCLQVGHLCCVSVGCLVPYQGRFRSCGLKSSIFLSGRKENDNVELIRQT